MFLGRCLAVASDLPPSLSDSTKFRLVVPRAGARPNKIPEIRDSARVNPKTGKLKAVGTRLSIPAGRKDKSKFMAQDPNTRAAAPPKQESKMLSVKSWRITRPRAAPTAVRKVISLRLSFARDSRRLATLAQDRKSTRLNSSHQIISYAVFCL